MGGIEKLEKKIRELVKTFAEREKFLEEGEHLFNKFRRALEKAAEEEYGSGKPFEVTVDDGKISIRVVYIPPGGFRVHIERLGLLEDVKERAAALASGTDNPTRYGEPLALLEHLVGGGAESLVKAIDEKIREEKELNEEIRRVLTRVKEALAPVVLALEV